MGYSVDRGLGESAIRHINPVLLHSRTGVPIFTIGSVPIIPCDIAMGSNICAKYGDGVPILRGRHCFVAPAVITQKDVVLQT